MNKVYAEITTKIIEQIQEGCVPWTQPWFGSNKVLSYATGREYSLLNQMILGGEPGEYLTWNQIQQHHAHLRKGSKGHRVFFWTTLDKAETNDKGETTIKKIPYLRTYTVFSVDDCDGIKRRWTRDSPTISTNTPIKRAEDVANQYLQREHIQLMHRHTNSAYYSVKFDHINTPALDKFRTAEDYYASLYHEMTHSTGHPSRLGRFKPGDKSSAYGTPNYSREELVAEMGASFLLRRLNIDNKGTFQQNAAYMSNWLRVLQNDVNLVAIAASKAERAVEFILNGKK